MQIQILSGIYVEDEALTVSYPLNLVPVAGESGVSNGQLKSAEGIILHVDGAAYGDDRGGINWDGLHIRVMGDKLVQIFSDGSGIELGTVSDATTA